MAAEGDGGATLLLNMERAVVPSSGLIDSSHEGFAFKMRRFTRIFRTSTKRYFSRGIFEFFLVKLKKQIVEQ